MIIPYRVSKHIEKCEGAFVLHVQVCTARQFKTLVFEQHHSDNSIDIMQTGTSGMLEAYRKRILRAGAGNELAFIVQQGDAEMISVSQRGLNTMSLAQDGAQDVQRLVQMAPQTNFKQSS